MYVKGDPEQIEQVIMNLISNGADAIEENAGVVSIRLAAIAMREKELLQYGMFTNTTLKNGIYALIEVKDTGIGMARETQKIIFDPFYTTKFIGRGLGLSAVLGIIRTHGGGIAIDSSPGKGTTFRVILPVDSTAMADVESVTASMSASTDRKNTVLIIDDENEIATVAQEMLEMAQYTALIELNPLQGIETFRQHQEDIGLVLLDMAMPEMSGKDVLQILQGINPEIPIIISSGYTEDELTQAIGASTVAGFLQKPYRLNSLLEHVDAILRRS